MGASCSTAPHEIPPEEMCVRVMMHAQRTASRRNSACSQLSAFVGSNMLQGQPPPAVLASAFDALPCDILRAAALPCPYAPPRANASSA